MRQRNLTWIVIVMALLFGMVIRSDGLHAMRDMLQYDEAYYAVNAISLIEQPRVQLFFPENTGREGLWMYILAPSIDILGATPFTLRFVALMASMLTLAAVFRLGREIFGSFTGGLYALLALTGLYIAEHNSHVAFRVLLYPLMGALALAFLLRAYRRIHDSRAWLVAGIFCGLLAYTYTAAHGWLGFLLFGCLILAWRDRARRRGAFTVIGIAAVIAAPMYLSMAAMPSPDGGLSRTMVASWDELVTNIRNWLLAWRGYSDVNPNNNLPNLSILDDIQALLAVIGLLASPFLVRKKWIVPLFIALFLLSLLPSLITQRTPQYIRAFGMIIPLALCIGGGALAIQRTAEKLNAKAQRREGAKKDEKPNTESQSDRDTEKSGSRENSSVVMVGAHHAAPADRQNNRRVHVKNDVPSSALGTRNSEPGTVFFAFIPLILLLLSALNTLSLWHTWLSTERLNLFIDDRINAGMAVIRADAAPAPIYFPYSGDTPDTTLSRHPVAEFHAYSMQRKLVFFPFPDKEGECFLTPREPAIYLDLPNLVNQTERRIAPYGTVESLYHQPDNDYNVLRFTPAADLIDDWPRAGTIGERIQVQAVAPVPQQIHAGETLIFRLGLRMLQPVMYPYRFFVHVQGIPTPYEGGRLFATGDAPLCQAALQPTRTPDETLVQTFSVALPADLAPGNYHIALGLYDPATSERLPLSAPDGETRFYKAFDFTVN